jgi:hypothetical protein
MMRFYGRDGRSIGRDEWMRQIEDHDHRRIGLDEVGDTHISTVWMGIDHSFWDHGPPVIFESMLFGGEFSGEMRRYHTEAEALEGHRHAVRNLQSGRAPW